MKKHKITIVIFTIFTIILVNFNNSNAKNSFDLFEEIISETNSCIEEYQMDIEFQCNNKDIYKGLLNSIKLTDNDYMKINSRNVSTVEFKKNNVYGYVKNIKNDNNTIIRIKIKEKGNDKNILYVKSSIKNYLNKKNINATYNECIKAKTKNNIRVANDIILNLINKKGFKNIETVKLSNGYSTVASNTKLKNIDFNCAVCKYNSGNYILIGTPQINISY